MIVPDDVPAASALENCASASGARPANAASTKPSSASAGGVGHHRHHVVERDAFLAVGVERELADLAARGLAVAADQRDERRARVWRDGEPGLAHLVVDQPEQIALGVGDSREHRRGSWPSRRPRGAARCGADRRLRSRCGNRSGGVADQPLDRGGKVAAAGLDPDRAPAAEQRHRVRLLDQPRRLGRQRVAVKTHQRERIARIVDRGLDELFDALAAPARRQARTPARSAAPGEAWPRRLRPRRSSARP